MTAKDIKLVKEFITWMRAQKIAYTTLSAGGITLDGVQDMKGTDTGKPAKPEPRESVFERFGGDLLRQPSAKASEIVPDEALDHD